MTIAYLALVFAILLPVFIAGYAKFSAGFKPRHNRAPRAFLEQQQGVSQRARWAEQNTYEALPAFFAAVVIAHQLQAAQGLVDALAVLFVLLRLAYVVCYVKDLPTLRSLVWVGGLASTIALVLIGF